METRAVVDNSQRTESIKELITEIDRGTIVLPEFQRDFVWEVAKTYDLFDSLVRDIFIGAIIYGVPSFEITVREIDKRPRKGEGSRKKLKKTSFSKKDVEQKAKTSNLRLVLDGQQRMTSVYRGLKGYDKVYFIVKSPNDRPQIDLDKMSLEELLHEFSGQEDRKRLSISLSDVWETVERTFRESEIQSRFFSNLSFVKEKTQEEQDFLFNEYLTISHKIQDMLKAEKLLSYYLLNTTSEKFSLFFERSNSKGIQLNFIDILAAKLYAGFNLRKKVEDFDDDKKGYELNREVIVRTISFLVSEGKEVDRTYILKTLNSDHFNKYWEEIITLYVKSLDFLYKDNFIISQQWMPYPNMLIPLMIFLREIGGNFSRMDQKQLQFLEFWYWSSVFSERYSLASNEIIVQDARALQEIAKGHPITNRAFFFKLKPQVEVYEDLYSYTKKGSAVYVGVLNLINFVSEGLTDWRNTSKLDFNSKLDDHHIFPREYLKKRYFDEETLELVDSVVNRTLIPATTNKEIGKKPPSTYFQDLKVPNPSLDRSLKKHLIPEGIITGDYDESYLDFLDYRAKAIFKYIEEKILTPWDSIKGEYYQESEEIE